MTMCKSLATGTNRDGEEVSAWECWDEDRTTPRYEITIDHRNNDRIGWADVIPAARTTWRKKFKELTAPPQTKNKPKGDLQK